MAAIEFEHAAKIRAVGPLLALAAHVDGPHAVAAGVEAAVSSQLGGVVGSGVGELGLAVGASGRAVISCRNVVYWGCDNSHRHDIL